MDREEFEEVANIKPSSQLIINSMVKELIARRGYESAIDELVAAVYNLGEISLADPENRAKLRDFDLWAHAVRTAIVDHFGETPFEARLTASDRRTAAEMGIQLD